MSAPETIPDILAEMRMGNTSGSPFAYRIGRVVPSTEHLFVEGAILKQTIPRMVIEKVTVPMLANRIERAIRNEYGHAQMWRKALKDIRDKIFYAPSALDVNLMEIFYIANNAYRINKEEQ